MLGSKTLGRTLIFGLGYVVGTRAGRERYAQMKSGARMVVDVLSARYEGDDGPADGPRQRSARNGYDDISLGR